MTVGEHSLTPEGDEGCYDPELPFLYALEREVRRHARHVAATRRRAHSARSHSELSHRSSYDSEHAEHENRARAPRVWLGGGRIARRSLTLLALLSLIGASAFGAEQIFSGGAPNPAAVQQSAFLALAGGTLGGERWSLRVYTRGEELCRVLVVGQDESSRCSAAPGSRSLTSTSALSPTRRYLFGVTGSRVATVSVRVVRADGGVSVRVHTRPLPPLQPVDPAGERVPHGERWYVAVLARPVGEPDPPLRLRGLDRDGHPVSVAVLDCPETTALGRCVP
jgi:hypothetical protein